MEKSIVRLAIYGISIYYILIIVRAFLDKETSDIPYILLFEYCLYILAKTQGKFHCKWARSLPLGIFVTELITYVDGLFNIVPNALIFLFILSGVWVLAIGVAMYRGINHFVKIQNFKKRYENNRLDKRG